MNDLATHRRTLLTDRLALRLKEAADALGVSERHLRTLLPEIPHVHLGSSVRIPVDALREWLREKAQQGHSVVDDAVLEVLQGLDSSI